MATKIRTFLRLPYTRLVYRVAYFRTRTRESDLFDRFLTAFHLRSMIGIFHRGSVSSISVKGFDYVIDDIFQYIFGMP